MADESTNTDPMVEVASALRGLTEGLGGAVATAVREANSAVIDEVRALVSRIPEPPPAPAGEPTPDDNAIRGLRPGERAAVDPSDRMRDPYTREWSEWYAHERLSPDEMRRRIRSLFEIGMLLQGGAQRIERPVNLVFPDSFVAAQRFYVHEAPGLDRIRVVEDARGERTRAMDSQETGYGLELIGVEYASDLWTAARNMDTLVADIRAVPMSQASQVVPINGAVPEMLFVSENTSPTASAYTTTKTPSSNVTLTSKKFTIQQIWSRELEEDAIIAFLPFLRDMLVVSYAQHLGSAYYNGDTTNAGTGNINTDDADPADTKHFLAWDGIRHDWLVTTTGQGKNMADVLDPAEINVARGKLSGQTNDVDGGITDIDWGANARDLRCVMDRGTYMQLLEAGKVSTVDKYGPGATVLTGELGEYGGIPIISPAYASKTEADGKASTTAASNTKGQVTVFAPRAYLGGVRRNTEFFLSRLQGRDQMLIELYARRAFTRFGTVGAAGIYNISL